MKAIIFKQDDPREFERAVLKFLIEERYQQGHTQKQVAKAMKQEESWVSQLERGNIRLRIGTLVQYATFLGYRVEVTMSRVEFKR